MNTFKVLSSVLLCIFFNTINAQTGPGGVGSTDGNSSLIIWYRPDNGISTTASLIDSWTNSAGLAAFNISETGSQRPTLISGTLNGYNEISFNGSNRLRTGLTLTSSNFVTNQASSFIVVKANNITQNSSVYTTDPLVGSTRFSNHIPWSGTVYYDIGSCCSSDARIQVGGLSGLTNYSIWSYDANPTTGKQLYRNESLLQNRANSSTYTSHASQRFNLGANTSGTGGFSGNVTEVIIFKNKVNKAQRIIIDNYLAAKYNQQLNNNDFYTRDNAGNGNYDHHVAGIGQADDGSNHTDSQGTGIVQISDPSSLSNNEFLFWGEETRNPAYDFSTNTHTFTEQLNSRWHVNTQGDLGTLTVSFDVSSIDLSGKQPCSDLQLAVDNNDDFSSPENIYPLTIVGTTATATGVTINNNQYFTLRYIDQIVWDGSSFFNGSGPENAPNTANACLKLTVKPGAAANLNFNAHVRAIAVDNGGSLNVSDGVLLETENEVMINGVFDLVGEAQLIQNHTSSSLNSGTGHLMIRQQGSSNMFNYNYWSAPVNRNGNWQIGYLEDATSVLNFSNTLNPDPTTIPITLSNQWLYSFNGLSGNYYDWSKLSTTSNIPPGIGYTMKGSGASTPEQEYIFKGIPNDGNYFLPVTENTDVLVGNPYPSALNADNFINDNLAVIDGSLHFWESFSTNNSHYLTNIEGGYATYNLMMALPAAADASGLTSGNGSASKSAPTPYINIGQGFFTSILNSGTLIFNNSQRAFARESVNETVYYRANLKNSQTQTPDGRSKIWFSFTGPKDYSKIIGLGYDRKTSYTYDKGYDSKSYNALKNDLYWLLDNESLSILALPEINIQDRLPLGIKILDAGIYTFSIHKHENIPTELNIYLVDNFQNIYFNLRDAAVQIFLSSDTLENQFSIAFQEDSILGTQDPDLKPLFASYDSNTKTLELFFKEDFNDTVERLTVYSLVGQAVVTLKSPNSNRIDLSNISDGVYILKLDTKSTKSYRNIKFVKH